MDDVENLKELHQAVIFHRLVDVLHLLVKDGFAVTKNNSNCPMTHD
jgi:hypothetical protein